MLESVQSPIEDEIIFQARAINGVSIENLRNEDGIILVVRPID